MRARLMLVALLTVALAAGAVYVLWHRLPEKLPHVIGRTCEVRTDDGSVFLDSDQMANAATIAAVGIRRGLPDQAVVVALATALQESKLRNLPGGDRDSVGLFQQRPSKGWGTVEEILDPRYAAGRFYTALLKVRDWQQMRVTDAAQKVQRSAYPEAYEKWADESTVLVQALSGRAGRAVACTAKGKPTARGALAAAELTEGMQLDWGNVTTLTIDGLIGLAVKAKNERAGWQFAHWLVAHSTDRNVQRVRFDNQEWSSARGTWTQVERTAGGGNRVVAEVFDTA